MKARRLIVEAAVRYWEDASVSDAEDTDGSLIPFRDLWCPIIDLATGQIDGWPYGTVASIHYKVCDQGEYWLANYAGRRLAKWMGHYVPNELLCIGETGYGDYIILKVAATGVIQGWSEPRINPEDWETTQ